MDKNQETEDMTDHTQQLDKTAVINSQEKAGHVIQCGSLLNIGGADELHKQLLTACRKGETVILDIANPERVDTAGIQILCSFIDYSKQKDIPVQWLNVPSVLKDTAARLGVGSVLEFPPE